MISILNLLLKTGLFVDADLFMTDAAKMAADIVPSGMYFLRTWRELETYPGGYAWLTKPVN